MQGVRTQEKFCLQALWGSSLLPPPPASRVTSYLSTAPQPRLSATPLNWLLKMNEFDKQVPPHLPTPQAAKLLYLLGPDPPPSQLHPDQSPPGRAPGFLVTPTSYLLAKIPPRGMSAGQWCNAPYPRSAGSESPARDSRDLYSCRARADEFPRARATRAFVWNLGGRQATPVLRGALEAGTLTQQQRTDRAAARNRGSPAKHPVLRTAWPLPTFPGIPRWEPMQVPQSPHPLGALHSLRQETLVLQAETDLDAWLWGCLTRAMPSFQETERLLNRGQTFRLNTGVAPAFPVTRNRNIWVFISCFSYSIFAL